MRLKITLNQKLYSMSTIKKLWKMYLQGLNELYGPMYRYHITPFI